MATMLIGFIACYSFAQSAQLVVACVADKLNPGIVLYRGLVCLQRRLSWSRFTVFQQTGTDSGEA